MTCTPASSWLTPARGDSESSPLLPLLLFFRDLSQAIEIPHRLCCPVLPAVSKKQYVRAPKQATSNQTIAASSQPLPGTKPNSLKTPSPETRRGGKTESFRGEVKIKSTGAWWNSFTYNNEQDCIIRN